MFLIKTADAKVLYMVGSQSQEKRLQQIYIQTADGVFPSGFIVPFPNK